MKRYQFEEVVLWLSLIATLMAHQMKLDLLYYVLLAYTVWQFFTATKFAIRSIAKDMSKKKAKETEA